MKFLTHRDIGYNICRRFEETLRRIIACEADVRGILIIQLLEESQKEKIIIRGAEDTDTNIEFLEKLDLIELRALIHKLKPECLIKHTPYSTNKEKFNEIFDSIYDLRCTVAHYRNTFGRYELITLINNCLEILPPGDGEALNLREEISKYLSGQKSELLNDEIIYRLENDGSKLITIPNNLPIPDYTDDGGFVGRSDNIKEICDLMRRNRIVTIAGAGGVGKSAIALECVRKIIDENIYKFDAIVWCSAKETKLSHLGIEDLEPDIKTLSDLLDKIAIVVCGSPLLHDTVESKKETILEILSNKTSILLILDNLETVTDAELIDFILDAPDELKILITSRRGLGQVERRVEIKAMKPKDAIHLFRVLSRNKGLDTLVKIEDETLRIYVEGLSYYPLIIKWAVGHVALGRDINDIIDRIKSADSDISAFCFDYIYSTLANPSRRLLVAVCLLDEGATPGLLKFVSNLDELSLTDAITELLLVSLITIENYKDANNTISRRFSALSLTRTYVRNTIKSDPTLRADIEDRWKTAQVGIMQVEEARNAVRFSLWSAGAVSDEEKIAATICNSAVQKSQAGQYGEAVTLFKRAAEIAPRFVNVYRSWAIAESFSGHFTDAETLIKKAIQLNPNDHNSWITYGNIKKKESHTRDALKFYLEAHRLAPQDRVVLSSLGQGYLAVDDYENAIRHLKQSLELNTDGVVEEYHKRINYSALAGAYLAWANSILKNNQNADVLYHLNSSLDSIKKAEVVGASDDYIFTQKINALYRLGLHLANIDTISAIKYLSDALDLIPRKYQHAVSYTKAAILLSKIYWTDGLKDEAIQILGYKILRRTRLLGSDIKLQVEQEKLLQLYKGDSEIKSGTIDRIAENGNFIILLDSITEKTVLAPLSSFLIRPRLDHGAWYGVKFYYVLEIPKNSRDVAQFAWIN